MQPSATEIARQLNAGEMTAEQVAGEALKRIAAYDAVQPQVWIERARADAVVDQARKVDSRIAAGERLVLAGVPYAVKDNIDVAGLPTTAGCPAFAYRPEASASVIARLDEAGALMMGKTNLDQFATGLVGVRSPYGVPGCVYNRDYISGGSSSGSAVATAAGLVAFALGSDTAGSGRVPAALNGLIGFKPTRGRWSNRGLVPACRSLDCISVFTAEAQDAALVDEVLAGPDAADPFSRQAPDRADLLPAQFRFGLPAPGRLQIFGDSQSQLLFEAAVKRLEALGGQPVSVDIQPLLSAARLLYGGPWLAERAAAVEGLLRDEPTAMHPTVRGIIEAGLKVSGVETFKGFYELQAFMRQAEAMWSSIDVLVLPTTPTTYRIAEVKAEPLALNSNLGLYTNFVNLLDMSAVAVPAGWRANRTGFGISLIGPAWSDKVLLDLARRYQASEPRIQAPPMDLHGLSKTVSLAVVGAHLAAMPLHWQLTSRNARLIAAARTAPVYRLYAMSGTQPLKPALMHVGEHGGAGIEVEVYELEMEAFGSFVTEVPAPLAIGSVTLADGNVVKGFVAEPRAVLGAEDITQWGGWRAYMRSL